MWYWFKENVVRVRNLCDFSVVDSIALTCKDGTYNTVNNLFTMLHAVPIYLTSSPPCSCVSLEILLNGYESNQLHGSLFSSDTLIRISIMYGTDSIKSLHCFFPT